MLIIKLIKNHWQLIDLKHWKVNWKTTKFCKAIILQLKNKNKKKLLSNMRIILKNSELNNNKNISC